MQSPAESISLALERHPEVVAAYLFGSAARGATSPLSDVDVAVLLADTPQNPLRYRARLTEELATVLGAPMDLVLLDEAPPALAGRVVREGRVLVCRDEAARVRFEIRALRRDLDTVHLRRLHDAVQSGAIREGRFYG